VDTTLISEKSTHKVPIIEVKLLPHDNSHSLSCVKVDDYICVVATKDWKDGDLAAWIPPDSLVDINNPLFSFLTKSLIRAKRLRGVISYGLLVPAPPTLKVGDDAAGVVNVTHYDPDDNILEPGKNKRPKDSLFVEQLEKSPSGTFPKYDVDSFQKYARKVFIEGEDIIVTEKIHGENARFVCVGGELFAGSRGTWKRQFVVLKYNEAELLEKLKDPEKVKKVLQSSGKQNSWWDMYDKYPGLKEFCKQNPGYCVYGEKYGNFPEMNYNVPPGERQFMAFDILSPEGRFLDWKDFSKLCEKYNIPTVPLLGYYHFNVERLLSFASGASMIRNANHIREGIVVKPVKERWDERLGRVCLKIVSIEYYEKKYKLQ